MKKLDPRVHWEPTRDVMKAADYVTKEQSRIEGPWEFGLRPARRNVSGETKERNKILIEMGAESAVD
jgi:hypothetical protein